jgi:uncharacterized protein YlxW (UPF0749 family)
MKKEKIVMAITIGISAFVLVAVTFMQFKVVQQTDITSIETMTESELRSELIAWREKYSELQLKHQDVLIKIEEYKEEYKSDEETERLLEKELKGLQMLLGETNVQGPGIIVTIREEKIEEDRITYEDLLYIVNELKTAGAEAISINNHRIINRTDIVEINSYIRVNGKNILAPYTIKAIGNQTYLESVLLGVGGYADELRKWGFEIEIERNENVQIDAYTNELSYKYIGN